MKLVTPPDRIAWSESTDPRIRAISDRARANRMLTEARAQMPGIWRFGVTGLVAGLCLGLAATGAPGAGYLLGTAVLAVVYGVLLGMRRSYLRREMAVADFERRKADEVLKVLEKGHPQ